MKGLDQYLTPPEDPPTFHDIEYCVVKWAKDREIISPNNARNQLLKCLEELGELSRAELKNDTEGIIDGLGDVLVTLIIYSNQKGLDLTDCLDTAYRVIKNRTGKTENGIFIKDGV